MKNATSKFNMLGLVKYVKLTSEMIIFELHLTASEAKVIFVATWAVGKIGSFKVSLFKSAKENSLVLRRIPLFWWWWHHEFVDWLELELQYFGKAVDKVIYC